MSIKKLREASGMKRREFCDFFGIPYRTVQNWELGIAQCPDYILKMIEEKLRATGKIKDDC